MIEEVKYKERLLAIIIRANFEKDGIQFFTPDSYSQQLAYMKRPEGHIIEPHTHNEVKREIVLTQEVLFIKSGKVRVDYYTSDQHYFGSDILLPGDVILLADGGHGFKMIEESEIIEVKQGPYVEDKDKTRFVPVADELVKKRES
ncbi:MAG: hypothetical protein WDZ35_05055 [Crocinitomicaceae bacterium]